MQRVCCCINKFNFQIQSTTKLSTILYNKVLRNHKQTLQFEYRKRNFNVNDETKINIDSCRNELALETEISELIRIIQVFVWSNVFKKYSIL